MKLYDSVTPELQEWAMKQQVFFAASAPYQGKHVNVSPKGLPSSSFQILEPNLCAYIDATGSGIETIANINENGRVTIMFCSFETSPKILRFFCTGKVVEWDQPEFNSWIHRMGDHKVIGARAVILLNVFKAQTSCGFAVPYLTLAEDPQDSSKQIPILADRQTLGHWGTKVIDSGKMDEYRAQNNHKSLDGLPGLVRARKDAGESIWMGDIEAVFKRQTGPLYTTLVVLATALTTVIGMYVSGVTTFKL